MWTAIGALTLLSCAVSSERDPYEMRRRELVDALAAQGISDPATLAALRAVPRHEFVPEDLRRYAYENAPLPIGREQTISQPYIVATMTQAIRPRPGLRVLEIGTGSGYQAAVLAEAGCRVYSIEILAELAGRARATLARLGYDSVQVRHGDGYLGWPEAAPFDAVVVTAAPETLPGTLLEQLAPGGRLVAPVGGERAGQELVLVEKAADGTLRTRELLPVRFVPMRRPSDTAR